MCNTSMKLLCPFSFKVIVPTVTVTAVVLTAFMAVYPGMLGRICCLLTHVRCLPALPKFQVPHDEALGTKYCNLNLSVPKAPIYGLLDHPFEYGNFQSNCLQKLQLCDFLHPLPRKGFGM